MRFQCPFCNNVIDIPDEYRGYRVACSSCDKRIIAPSTPFEDGCVIGDFVLRSKLGEGAIGAVYKAFQLSLERVVALKILSNKHITEKGLAEFQREARAAAKLIHVNLVQSYAVGEDNGICYMAMTYISGETLKARIRRTGPIPCDEALHIIQQVAEALHYAWTESHLIHRDVKPDNIMIAENGIVKLTDLGLAMNQAEWRQDMDISGSPSYMSPEQFGGEKLDTRSDIYSLGVTLYQMLSGELPFDAETIRSIARQHFEVAVPDINKKVSGLPPSVGRLIKKMMAKTPEKRFKDMEELLSEIWKIRQQTAPHQDLVPDVHTISMRRLDYDVQLQQTDSSKANRDHSESGKKSTRSIVGILLIIFLLVCILAILGISYQKMKPVVNENVAQQDQTNPIYEQIVNFEKLAKDPALSYEELRKEAQPLLASIARETNMHAGLKSVLETFVLELLKKKSGQNELEEAKKINDEQKNRINQLTQDLESLRIKEEASKRTIEELQGKLDAKITELADKELLQGDLEKAKNELAREQKISSAGMPLLLELINKKTLFYWQKQDYAACDVWLDEMEVKYFEFQDSFKAHLANLSKFNDILKKMSERIHKTTTECAGLVLSVGTVSHLEGGAVCFFVKDDSGNIKLNKIPWNELPPDDLINVLRYKKRYRSEDETEEADLFNEDEWPAVKAVYCVMSGDCTSFYNAVSSTVTTEGVAPLIDPSYVESLKGLADTRAVTMANLIRILCENGKVPTKNLFLLYQKNCQHSPDYHENIKEFQPYFEKKETARPVDKTAVP